MKTPLRETTKRESLMHRSHSWESQFPAEYKDDGENAENRTYKPSSLRNSGSNSNLRKGTNSKPQSPKELKKSPSFQRSPITTPLTRSPSSSSPQMSPVSIRLFLYVLM